MQDGRKGRKLRKKDGEKFRDFFESFQQSLST